VILTQLQMKALIMNTIKPSIILIFTLLLFTPYTFAERQEHQKMLNEIEYQIDQHNWEKAKGLIDFFQNASERQGTFIAYQIDQYNVMVTQTIRDEKPLFDRLAVNFSIDDANDYLDQYPYGKYTDQVNRLIRKQDEAFQWQQAKTHHSYQSYQHYLSDYPQGKYTRLAKQNIAQLEQFEYQRAIELNTSSAFDQFLSMYPNSQYSSEIHALQVKQHQQYDYQQALRYDSISSLEDFLIKYPTGPYSQEVQSRLANAYLDAGDFAFSRKNYTVAQKHYEKFLNSNTDNGLNQSVEEKLSISKRYAHQSGGIVSMFTMDTSGSAGYTFAQLDTATPGFYFSLKFKPEAVDHDSLVTIDDNDVFTGVRAGTPTGDTKSTSFSISTGMTYQLHYPIWAYMGAGFEFRSQYEEVQTTDVFNNTEFVWARNTDQDKVFIAPEAGILIKLSNASLNYGVRYTDTLVHQVGLGVVF